ncbi:MAG: EAL domain-containing protein [Solidesulfovibrio magneticus str. Maddingley MBC34]|uniref:EAL domain-containing protein n=1 Tax=Solidesulfovibrio magneticus str. Maddingley MBC34 TaxID=1206767 RepID=K6GCE9_9BACT|nr:MAG: EAL domain-containing protein [Solidesulfovibrio magneticus str. Maddingley MBC34]
MAHTFDQAGLAVRLGRSLAEDAGVVRQDIYFRALVDLGDGGVAGIEAARMLGARHEDASLRSASWVVPGGDDALAAWGRELRDPAAYLLRGDHLEAAGDLGLTRGVSPERIIAMYDVAELLADPGRSLDMLLAAKRRGVRVLLDNFDLDNPPARFMELLPADILRVTPRQLPWHWDEARRSEVMSSLVQFADNLLMDVAVAGVECSGYRLALKRLGVRYAQGVWRRDTAGVIPDTGYLP